MCASCNQEQIFRHAQTRGAIWFFYQTSENKRKVCHSTRHGRIVRLHSSCPPSIKFNLITKTFLASNFVFPCRHYSRSSSCRQDTSLAIGQLSGLIINSCISDQSSVAWNCAEWTLSFLLIKALLWASILLTMDNSGRFYRTCTPFFTIQAENRRPAKYFAVGYKAGHQPSALRTQTSSSILELSLTFIIWFFT